MGMYDIFGSSGDQLKIFSVPVYYFSEGHYNEFKDTGREYKFLGYMGGNLRHFSVGDEVPWRALSYNYTKSFVAIYDGFFEGENPIVFSFMDGKFVGYSQYFLESQTFEESIDIDLNKQIVIDYYGANYTTNDLYLLINGLISEYKNRIDIIKKYAQMSIGLFNPHLEEEEKELRENEINCLSQFLPHEDDIKIQNKYQDYGAYIELINRYECRKNDDEYKLFYEALLNEAHTFVNKNNIDIEFYFCWNNTPYEDRQWIRKIDEIIRKG